MNNHMYELLSARGKVAALTIDKIIDGFTLAEIKLIQESVFDNLEYSATYRLPGEVPITPAECQTMIDVAVKNNCSPEKISEVINQNLSEIADKIAGELAANLAKSKG